MIVFVAFFDPRCRTGTPRGREPGGGAPTNAEEVALYLTGPFSHCEVCVPCSQGGLSAKVDHLGRDTTYSACWISQSTHGVRWRDHKSYLPHDGFPATADRGAVRPRPGGYSFLAFRVRSVSRYNSMVQAAKALAAADTTMAPTTRQLADWAAPACMQPRRPTLDTRAWHCAQLTAFLLQVAGILGEDVNPSRLSPTDVYKMVTRTQTNNPPLLPLEQFRLSHADRAYAHLIGKGDGLLQDDDDG